MFHRVVGSGYRSLICHKNIIRSTPYRVSQCQSSGSLRYWYTSIATSRSEEQHDQYEEQGEEQSKHQQKQRQENESTNITPLSTPYLPPWFYSEKASLGVDVLGKPAEVLIVTPRLKPIDQQERDEAKDVDTGDTVAQNDDQKGLFVSKLLATDPKYLSTEEAISVIGAIKEQLHQHEEHLSPATLLAYRDHLAKGFKISQLLAYLQSENLARSVQGENKIIQAVGFRRARDISSHIMESLWGYTIVEEDQRSLMNSRLKMTRDQLQLLTSYRHRRLTELAELNEVEIDILSADEVLEVTGSSKNTAEVMKHLKLLKDHMVSGSYEIPQQALDVFAKPRLDTSSTKPGSDYGDELRSIYNNLRGNYEAIISASPNKIEFLSFNHDMVNIIDREICMKIREILTKAQSAKTVRFDVEPVSEVHVCNYESDRTQLKSSNLQRVITRDSVDKEVLPAQISDEQLQRLVLATRSQSHVTYGLNSVNTGSWKKHFGIIQQSQTAEFGQSLAEVGRYDSASTSNRVTTQLKHVFTNDLPSIPQTLAQLYQIEVIKDRFMTDLMLPDVRTIRLVFRPSLPSPDSYSFEVYVARRVLENDEVAGYDILQIKMLLEDTTTFLLFPGNTADVKFNQQSYIDIFPILKSDRKQNTGIREQFVRYLKNSFTSSKDADQFNAILHLQLPASQPASKDKMSFSDDQPQILEPQKSKISSATKIKAKYVLEDAEYIGRNIYECPISNHFLLEYLTYTPLTCSTSQHPREVLRLSDPPMLCRAADLPPKSKSEGASSTGETTDTVLDPPRIAKVSRSPKRARRLIRAARDMCRALSLFARETRIAKSDP